ncbi:MAG TPA: gamma-glutamylcyclotransferase [Dongiaceae bacterium]|jgi:cation transport protein ChaC|nr:gamma-glutamylcyclotransferase [Dongiaceae bacterium]
MALTADLVARVERIEPDPGPMPGQACLTDPEYDALAHELVQENGDQPFWIFAYGSLIWKPECAFSEHRRATAHGWHRSFCLKLTRWRGTPDCPGLMMALDRGGRCDGVICRLPDEDRAAQLRLLLVREIESRTEVGVFRWISVAAGGEKIRALTFYAGPRADYYTGRLPVDEVARTLARAAGHWGSCANYLYQTITKLEEYGIHDGGLWRLQQKVAEEIAALEQ